MRQGLVMSIIEVSFRPAQYAKRPRSQSSFELSFQSEIEGVAKLVNQIAPRKTFLKSSGKIFADLTPPTSELTHGDKKDRLWISGRISAFALPHLEVTINSLTFESYPANQLRTTRSPDIVNTCTAPTSLRFSGGSGEALWLPLYREIVNISHGHCAIKCWWTNIHRMSSPLPHVKSCHFATVRCARC